MAKEILLSRGKVAIVDDEDYEWLSQHKWYYGADSKGCSGYAYRQITCKIDGKTKVKNIFMHKAILGIDANMQGDHIDSDTLNNQRSNLRSVTEQQNRFNNKKWRKKTTSIFKGVCWSKKNKKWIARIKVYQKTIYLGLFANEIEAAKAYNKAALKLHGEYAKLNQI